MAYFGAGNNEYGSYEHEYWNPHRTQHMAPPPHSPYGAPPPAYPGGQPPPPGPGPRKPGLLEAPGAYENWYSQYQKRGPRQNRRGDYWNSISGKVMSGGRIGSAYDKFSSTLSGPRHGVNAARDASSYFTMPGQGEQWVRGNQSQFDGPGAAEGNLANAQRSLSGINYGQQALRSAREGVKGAQKTGGYFSSTLQPYATGGTAIDQEYGYFMPGLREKSYSETAYESGAGGLIDPYARAQEKQTRAIRDAAAARGQFNSERALRLEEELGADIAAEEARDRIQLAGQADQARLGRTGAALDFADSAERATGARRAMGLEGAIASDESARANLGVEQDAYGLASGEALKKVGLETDAADIAQRSMIDRLMSGGKFGLMADEAGRSRMKLSAETGLAADEEERAVMDALLKGAGYTDSSEMDWMTRGMGLGGAADDGYRADDELDAGFADKAQDRYEGRLRGGLDDTLRVSATQAQFLMTQLDEASQRYFQQQLDALENQVASGAITQQQAEQSREELYQSIANFVRTRQAPPTGGTK